LAAIIREIAEIVCGEWELSGDDLADLLVGAASGGGLVRVRVRVRVGVGVGVRVGVRVRVRVGVSKPDPNLTMSGCRPISEGG